MTYSVLTKVTNATYHGQKFYMYKHEGQPKALDKKEADSLVKIFNDYPSVFSETEIIPREDSEIKLLDLDRPETDRPLDFDFENVSDDCEGIIDKLNDNFDSRIFGIDRKETVRQTFENKE